MKHELVPIALLLIALHFVVGYGGAWLAGVILRRAGRSLSGRATFVCGMLGALVAIAAALAAFPVSAGLIAAPVLGGLFALAWSRFGKAESAV